MEKRVLNISPAPHMHSGNSINKIMLDFIIALLPAAGVGIYFYKKDAIVTIIAAVLTSLIIEIIWNKFVKNEGYKVDLSPIFSGLILALILPTYVPAWVVVIGAIFSTLVCKLIFGGLGQNFMNPAAATKAFLIASWAAIMAKPVGLVMPEVAKDITIFEKIISYPRGNIGEASILAIIVGALYLVVRGRINLRAPIMFLIAAYSMNMYFGKEGLLQASFFFSAFFLATDYATTPMTKVGQYLFGLGAGVIASVIVNQGFNPEGPYYAIIIMNLTSPLIEYFTTKKFKEEVAK